MVCLVVNIQVFRCTDLSRKCLFLSGWLGLQSTGLPHRRLELWSVVIVALRTLHTRWHLQASFVTLGTWHISSSTNEAGTLRQTTTFEAKLSVFILCLNLTHNSLCLNQTKMLFLHMSNAMFGFLGQSIEITQPPFWCLVALGWYFNRRLLSWGHPFNKPCCGLYERK